MSSDRVPEGYKQTEVGVVPEDWEVRKISSIGDVVRGGSPRPAGSYVPWLTVASLTNIPVHQLNVYETHGGLTEEGAKRSRTLERGTIIIANSGATLGVAKILDIQCCANDGIAAVINQKCGDKQYICHFINTKTKELREVVATGNGQPNLNTTLIKELLVPFPPLLEQQTIAHALSDVDALIASLDKLIAKQRQLKTAAMQQLLTGKMRSFGFGEGMGYKQTEVGLIPEDWEVYHLETLASQPIQNGVFTDPTRKGNGCKLINVGDLYSSIPINSEKLEFFDANQDEIKRFGVFQGDIFFTRSSLTPDGIAHCNIYTEAEANVVFDCHLIRFRPNANLISPQFFFRYCATAEARKYLVANSKTTTMTTIDQGVISKLPIPVPSLEEQHAIATVLSDMDTAIAALEIRRTKTQAIKQGMMQELLTGRTRLV
jgi:type I restriction enzyme, S subunit